MDVKLKRVYEAPSAGDGFRILTDRLWPRGISKEKAQLGVWEHLAEGPVTLLFGAKDTEHNQAVVLKEFLAQR